MSRGDIDAMMMAWLPETHADYYKRVEGKVENLGPLYEGAKLGWIVPDYIPESEVSSIEDLKKPEVREKLKGEIQGSIRARASPACRRKRSRNMGWITSSIFRARRQC